MGLKTRAFDVAEAMGWSMDELAARSGIARSTLYAIRSGDRKVGPKTIAGLMQAFPKLTFERLFVATESTKSDHKSDLATPEALAAA